ncbi:MAG: AAA family ATPase [Methanomicrobiales archaeon]|nr:AAA family ATPase [Methanomicrobiales archaeon]
MQILPEWEALASLLEQSGGGCVYVAGATDRGKSTLCRYLTETLADSLPAAFIDTDTGQSSIGPPATIGMAWHPATATRPAAVFLRFTGSTSPRRQIPAYFAAARRLLDHARMLGARAVIIDTPGYVTGPAAEAFHIALIDLVRPDHIVACEHGHEIDPILRTFSSGRAIRIHRFPVSPAVRVRSRIDRARNREMKFKEYFLNAKVQDITLAGCGIFGDLPETLFPGAWEGRLCALCDTDFFVLALGVVETLDPERGCMRMLAPPFDAGRIAAVHIGSLSLREQKCPP